VTINELSRVELKERGITATTVYNAFDTGSGLTGAGDEPIDDGHGDRVARSALRQRLGIDPGARVVLQPTRAIPRKNVGGGIGVATALGATYWLLGPAEDGFDAELDALVATARCPVVRGVPDGIAGFTVVDAYQACDVVTLPSTWEGFGNPSIESVLHRRPLAIGPYPVAAELAAFGFEWFALDQVDRLGAWLEAPDPGLLDRNMEVASTHFSLRDLPTRITTVLPDL
jgi:glycosyltransferase involved in cell wall biosynthesis